MLAGALAFVVLFYIVQVKAHLPLKYVLPTTGVVVFAVAVICILARDFFYVYTKRTLAAVGLLCVISTFSMLALLNSEETTEFNWASAGTVLILFTALMTVTGFLITITRLNEYHVRITTYDEFLMHLERFLATSSHLGTGGLNPSEWFEKQVLKRWHKRRDNNEGIKILCTVPTLGNISHYPFFYRYVRRRWRQLANSGVLVDMICINPDVIWDTLPELPAIGGEPSYDLSNFTASAPNYRDWDALLKNSSIGKFYNEEFAGKRKYQIPEVLRGMTQAIEVVCWLKHGLSGRPPNKINGYSWPYDHAELPPMHLFWRRNAALVAFPLDRGVQSGSPNDPVQLIGYATTDPRIIYRLLEVFEEWKTHLTVTRL